ncbi:MAG: hypothetical protein M3Q86_06980, partial [Verrucomicrobiota bacterium]|nr:hypothetical protein [Verrucomicrobiota bacterium]
ARAARLANAAAREFSGAKASVEELLDSRRHNLSREQFRAWRKAVRLGIMPAAADPPIAPFLEFWQAAAALAEAESSLGEALAREMETARQALMEAARRYLPRYLVFAASGVRDLLVEGATGPLPPRNKSRRARERHLLLYLQRVCGKNDTLSEFGPHGWGTAVAGAKSIQLLPRDGIARREVFLERWTAHGAAAAINADPLTRDEIAPRLHPAGRIEGDGFLKTETGEKLPLTLEERALLARCDGTMPAHSLGGKAETLAGFAGRNLIRWEMEVPAIDPHAFEVILREVARWREGPVRERWLTALQPFVDAAAEFAATSEPMTRFELIEKTAKGLETLGAHKTASRFLYAATNSIGEECFRETGFAIGEDLLNEVMDQAAPWIDLWRDNYAYVASRVAAGLRGLLEQAPLLDGAIALPAFLRHCAEMQMPITGPGMIAFAHLAFREVKAAFAERLQAHAGKAEYELTAGDCDFVRREFDYDRFDEYTYPSADLQLGAASLAAVEGGEYQWVLAELHPSVALLHHGYYWSCPDQAALSDALRRSVCGQPNFHFGYFAVDFTATTAVRFFDALPDLTYFVAPQRGHPEWKSVPPAECEVFIQPENGDVALRRRGSHEYLGSFARAWTIPLGFHPFGFSLGRDTPRLLCGKVVVQRRSWTITSEELGAGDFTGISRDLVRAAERLRAARGLPRHVYIRPTEQALRRSGVEGRDKDTKPVFLDLESYLFLEILHRWLSKAGELEVTEMLPAPDQLLWQEADGRRTFELRTQVIPR